MNFFVAFLFNFFVNTVVTFLFFALLMEGFISLFRMKNFRLIYWLRLIPFLKLPFSFFNYSGNSWLSAMGGLIGEQAEGTRSIGIALGYDFFPFLKIYAVNQDNLHFALGDVIRELTSSHFPTLFLIFLTSVSLLLLFYHCYQTLSSHLKLNQELRNATLIQNKPCAAPQKLDTGIRN